jgi:hypothetical protein
MRPESLSPILYKLQYCRSHDRNASFTNFQQPFGGVPVERLSPSSNEYSHSFRIVKRPTSCHKRVSQHPLNRRMVQNNTLPPGPLKPVSSALGRSEPDTKVDTIRGEYTCINLNGCEQGTSLTPLHRREQACHKSGGDRPKRAFSGIWHTGSMLVE